jgi:hypothetical protein
MTTEFVSAAAEERRHRIEGGDPYPAGAEHRFEVHRHDLLGVVLVRRLNDRPCAGWSSPTVSPWGCAYWSPGEMSAGQQSSSAEAPIGIPAKWPHPLDHLLFGQSGRVR